MKLITMFLMAAAAQAQTCQPVRIEGTEPLVQAVAERSLRGRMQALRNEGADVAVMILDRVGAPTLDMRARSEFKNCPNWQAPDGGMKNNLILTMVAIRDRKVGIYYGSQWKRALDGNTLDIQAHVMAPKFREGEYAEGIAMGLQAMETAIAADKATIVGRPVVVNESKPMDLGWVPWATVVAGVILLIFLLVRYLGKRREQNEERSGEQQRALIAQQEVSSLLADLCAREGNLGAGQPSYRAACEAAARLGMGVTDPTNGMLTASQYRAIANAYLDVKKQLLYAKDLSESKHPSREEETIKSAGFSAEAHRHKKHKPIGDRLYGTPVSGAPEVRPVYIDPIAPQPIFIPVVEDHVVVEHHVVETPSYSEPASSPSYESSSSGSSTDFGSSFDSGSSSDFGSSVDSGSSTDW